MSSFSVVERLLFIARRADASFSACVGSKKEQKQKVPEFCMMNYGTFYVIVCIYLSDCLFGCKEQ